MKNILSFSIVINFQEIYNYVKHVTKGVLHSISSLKVPRPTLNIPERVSNYILNKNTYLEKYAQVLENKQVDIFDLDSSVKKLLRNGQALQEQVDAFDVVSLNDARLEDIARKFYALATDYGSCKSNFRSNEALIKTIDGFISDAGFSNDILENSLGYSLYASLFVATMKCVGISIWYTVPPSVTLAVTGSYLDFLANQEVAHLIITKINLVELKYMHLSAFQNLTIFEQNLPRLENDIMDIVSIAEKLKE